MPGEAAGGGGAAALSPSSPPTPAGLHSKYVCLSVPVQMCVMHGVCIILVYLLIRPVALPDCFLFYHSLFRISC